MTVAERLLATQTKPWPTVIPAGPRPARIGGPTAMVPRSILRTVPVLALLTQRPPAPTASRSGAACGASPRLITRARGPSIAVTPAPSSSATQIRPPPETIAPGLPPR